MNGLKILPAYAGVIRFVKSGLLGDHDSSRVCGGDPSYI